MLASNVVCCFELSNLNKYFVVAVVVVVVAVVAVDNHNKTHSRIDINLKGFLKKHTCSLLFAKLYILIIIINTKLTSYTSH